MRKIKRNAVKNVTSVVEIIALNERISKKARYPAMVNAMMAARIIPAIRELKNIPEITIQYAFKIAVTDLLCS